MDTGKDDGLSCIAMSGSGGHKSFPKRLVAPASIISAMHLMATTAERLALKAAPTALAAHDAG